MEAHNLHTVSLVVEKKFSPPPHNNSKIVFNSYNLIYNTLLCYFIRGGEKICKTQVPFKMHVFIEI